MEDQEKRQTDLESAMGEKLEVVSSFEKQLREMRASEDILKSEANTRPAVITARRRANCRPPPCQLPARRHANCRPAAYQLAARRHTNCRPNCIPTAGQTAC